MGVGGDTRTEGRGFRLRALRSDGLAGALAEAVSLGQIAFVVLGVWACMCAGVHAATPSRIVSTSPSITETLFALGLGDRVVGVSRYCRYPEEVTRLPQVGTFLKPDAELIARLRPDLVIVHGGPHDIEGRLTALRIPHVVVERGTLASVYSSIRQIGDAAGVADRADALIASIDQRLARVRDAVAARPRRKVLVIVGRQAGTLTDLIAVGRDSYLNDLVTLAGGVNLLAGAALPEYPRISMETVIRLAPDVIIDDGEMAQTVEERRERSKATLRLWRAAPVTAAREDRVYTVPSEAFTVPGPRVVDVAATLAQWLHGVRIE